MANSRTALSSGALGWAVQQPSVQRVKKTNSACRQGPRKGDSRTRLDPGKRGAEREETRGPGGEGKKEGLLCKTRILCKTNLVKPALVFNSQAALADR